MRYRGELNRNLGSLLKQHFGTDKRSLHDLEHKTGIRVRTIRSHQAGKSGPYFEDLCSYMKEGGPEFVSAVFRSWGYRAVLLKTTDEYACTLAVGEVVAEFVYEKAKADADGTIDYREAPRLARFANKAAAWLAGFSYSLKARAQ